MTTTPILGIQQVATNQNEKELTINDGFLRLEKSLNDVLAISMAAGNVTVTLDDFQSHFYLSVSGQTATRTLTIPVSKRMFAVGNSGAYAITVTTGSGVTATVGAGAVCVILGDNTINLKLIANSAAAGSSPTFIGLTDVPGSYTGGALKVLRVNAGVNGIEFHTLTLPELPEFGTPVTNYYPKWNGTQFTWTAAGGGPGAVNFKDLADVPASYTGANSKLVRMNSAATALEFVAKDAFLGLRDLTDVPDSISGFSGRVLAVNVSETGFTFINLPTLGVPATIVTGDTNAGFELGVLSPWVVSVGAGGDATISIGGGGFSAQTGTYFMQIYSATDTDCKVVRTYDLTLMALNSELDNNSRIDLPYAFVRRNAGSTGTITMTALNSVNTAIGTNVSSTLSTSVDVWSVGSQSYTLPAGTRKLKIELAVHSTSSVNAGWDNCDPQLNITRAAGFTTLTDVPTSYTGQAGKYTRVKSTEDGLEFAVPSLIKLSDAPTTYSGKAGYVVRVNTAATAIEFVPETTILGTTDDLAEGTVHLFYTNARGIASTLTSFAVSGTRTAIVAADTILSAFGKAQKYFNDLAAVAFSGAYSDLTGTPTIPTALSSLTGTTDNVTEGSTNKYWTNARTIASTLTSFAVAGTRTAIVATDSVLTAFGKAQKYFNDLATVAFSGDYNDLTNKPSSFGTYSGTTDGITEGTTNLYFTAARVRATVLTGFAVGTRTTIAATDTILAAFGKVQKYLNDLATVAFTGAYSDLTGTPTIPTALGSLTGTTDNVTEGSTNKYWTNARTITAVLTGFAVGTRTAIVATDTILAAFGKVQKYFNDLAAVSFSGSSADLTEATNLFYTDTRVKAVVKKNLVFVSVGVASTNMTLTLPITESYSIPINATGSSGKATVAATAQADVTIAKNGTTIGTVRWAAAGTVPTFVSFSGAVSLAAGDYLTAIFPGTPDATLANASFSLLATWS